MIIGLIKLSVAANMSVMDVSGILVWFDCKILQVVGESGKAVGEVVVDVDVGEEGR